MAFLDKYRPEVVARADAEAGINLVEERITERFGAMPDLDPIAHNHHRVFVETVARRPELNERREDEERHEAALRDQPSIWGLRLGLVLTFVAEAFAAILLFRALGFPPSERIIFGLMLAAFILVVTIITGSILNANAKLRGGIRRVAVAVVVIFAYGIIIGSITIVRYGTEGGESPSSFRVATAVLLCLTSIGPALLADWISRKLRTANHHSHARQAAHRRRVEVEREIARSDKAIADLSRQAEAWRSETARFRARYEASFRRARAEIESHNPRRERGE